MKKKPKNVVTIIEIARQAGVSPASVSSVLSNRHVERRISEATVQRIREATRKLGYIPNMAGRRLRTSESNVRQIDITILTSFEAPLSLVEQAVKELQLAAESLEDETTRYSISIEMFYAGKLAEKTGIMDANRYHGVVFTNTLPPDDVFLEKNEFPYSSVVLGRDIPGKYCVLEEPSIVGSRAAKMLIDAGSERPAILYGAMLTQATSNRIDAFEKAVFEALGKKPIRIVAPDLQPKAGANVMTKALKSKKRFDSVFSVTDSLAIGGFKAVAAAGLRIPDDILFVGVGDHEEAEFMEPPMSTVAGSNDDMFKKAIPMLFDQFNGTEKKPSVEYVTPLMSVRKSSCR